MTIVRENIIIPDDIAEKIATGSYCRSGSVVRYATGPNKGQIVKHLNSIDLNTVEQAQGEGAKALQFLKNHKKGAIFTVVGIVVIGAAVCIYNNVKNHEPKVVAEFRTAFGVYIDAIRDGNMDIDKINTLINKLDALKLHKDYAKINIKLTVESLEVLVERIYDYTIKLANDNNVKLTNEELNISSADKSNTITNLQSYLRIQKTIFEKAA